MAEHRIYKMSFASIYPHYITKALKKERTEEEVVKAITWLTGYTEVELRKTIDDEITMKEFFDNAPMLNPKVHLITGRVCGVKIEDVEEPLMKKIRYMDKLVDEIAKGKKMDKVLREV